MSNKDFPKQINITSPCSADWDSMIGNDQIRFCQHCQLSVNNLDSMSKKRVRRDCFIAMSWYARVRQESDALCKAQKRSSSSQRQA